MTRGSHGVAPGAGHYYYEVVLQQQPFGAHVRLGWSMRTGDLQAPVGYDKWSYGVRDIQGSKIHCSKREDHWGGEAFGPGDVIGCAISMGGTSAAASEIPPESSSTAAGSAAAAAGGKSNHNAAENTIRFFKNGYPMGEFVITKGKREGGVAFSIPDGVYYPAISLYMGATVKVNFGPHFIYNPRKLPTALSSKYHTNNSSSSSSKSKSKKSSSSSSSGGSHNPFQPVANLSRPPLTVEEAAAKVTKEQKTLFFRRVDQTELKQQRFLELVETEARLVRDAYTHHRRKHVLDIVAERKNRNLKWDDLERDEYYTTSTTTDTDKDTVAAAAAAGSNSNSNSNI
eukprot:jgi/Psemu1/264258/estExt_Genewise1Plus.C_15350011